MRSFMNPPWAIRGLDQKEFHDGESAVMFLMEAGVPEIVAKVMVMVLLMMKSMLRMWSSPSRQNTWDIVHWIYFTLMWCLLRSQFNSYFKKVKEKKSLTPVFFVICSGRSTSFLKKMLGCYFAFLVVWVRTQANFLCERFWQERAVHLIIRKEAFYVMFCCFLALFVIYCVHMRKWESVFRIHFRIEQPLKIRDLNLRSILPDQ